MPGQRAIQCPYFHGQEVPLDAVLPTPRQLTLYLSREGVGNLAQVARFCNVPIGNPAAIGKLMAVMTLAGRKAVFGQLALRWAVELDGVSLRSAISPKNLYASDPELLTEHTGRAQHDMWPLLTPYANRAVLNVPWIASIGKKLSQAGQNCQPLDIIHRKILPLIEENTSLELI